MQAGMLAGTVYLSIVYEDLTFDPQTFILDYYGAATNTIY